MPRTRVVKPGDCFVSLGAKFGFESWKDLYDHPGNAGLRRTRENPNVLRPGDKIEVPDSQTVEQRVSSGASHTVEVKRETVSLRLQLLGADEHRYELAAGTEKFEGEVKASEPLAHEIDPQLKEAKLKVWPKKFATFEEAGALGALLTLQVGHLRPLDTVEGVKARLRNLGYYGGKVDDAEDQDLEEALSRFQEDNPPLTKTGKTDEATRKALGEKHGC